MAASKDDIIKALLQLDSGNDKHWTDDGLPRIDVVQQLLKDPTVRRKDVNDAQPGFARANPDATTEPEDVQDGDPVVLTAQAEDNDDGDDFLGEATLEETELKAVMQKRVLEAEERVTKARTAVVEAQKHVNKCERWLNKAKEDLHLRFPPLHPSDAIKQHLESQLRQRYERAGIGPSQIDAAMGIRGKRGWGRPKPTVKA